MPAPPAPTIAKDTIIRPWYLAVPRSSRGRRGKGSAAWSAGCRRFSAAAASKSPLVGLA